MGKAFSLGNNSQYIVPVECVIEKSSGLLLALSVMTKAFGSLCFRSLTDPCASECLVLFPCVCYFSQQA